MTSKTPAHTADLFTLEDQVARTAEISGPEFDAGVLKLTLRFYRAMAAFERAHITELSPRGLTVGQFNVLNVLYRGRAPISMRQLSDAVAVRPTQLTGVVERLHSRGLLNRELNAHDRRSFMVSISEDGRAFLAEFLPDHWVYLKQLLAQVSEKDREALAALLGQLYDSVEAAVSSA